jgi:hypothetical protein
VSETGTDAFPDPHVRQLAELFASHPVWLDAARSIAEGATSRVYFSHRPGEPWQLERHRGRSLLAPGCASDPDFAFRFTPAAIERMVAVEGGVGDFAVVLFRLIIDEDADLRVGFRIVAPLTRLARRGYLSLLLRGGPKVVAFGAAHGVRTLGALHRLVAQLVAREPEPWEQAGPAAPRRGE